MSETTLGQVPLDEAASGSRIAGASAAGSGLAWGLAAAAAWGLTSLLTLAWPDAAEFTYTSLFGWGLGGIAALIAGVALFAHGHVRGAAPWLVTLAVFFGLWELLSAKLIWLPQPFFPPPQSLIEVYIDDWPRLGLSALYSLRLLAVGYAVGALVGFGVGIAMGWSKAASYWIHPVLRFIGPLPAVAWLPLAFFAFPSSWSASVFLIALATGFPVAILTWSGVAAVPSAYYDVARTLGANGRFLVLKVAIPAAMPSVFVGLFMGLGASFAVLIVAEMLGVKAGLGWYLQWAQGWAAYANMYAALIVMSIVCSGLVGLLFRVRDRLLGWQKGLVRW